MGIDVKQFHQTFFDESFEGLDVMESALLGLDVGQADAEIINTIFRAAHSIKGGSGTFGFTQVSAFTHLVETLLDEMRSGTRVVSQNALDALLVSVDVLRAMLIAVRDDCEPDTDSVADAQAQLRALLDADSEREHGNSSAQAVQHTGEPGGWLIRFRPHAEMFRTGNDPVRIIRELEELGDVEVSCNLEGLPDWEHLDPEVCYLAWDIRLHGTVAKAAISEVFEWVEDECELNVEPLRDDAPESPADDVGSHAAASSPVPSKSARRGVRAGGESGSIRVDIEKVDAIINLVGELVITQSMLGQMGESMEDCPGLDLDRYEKLRDGLAQLERNTRELQESVMQIRMLPISFAFNRFPRLVRDLSKALDKQVELRLAGEQTELDKTVMERIGDPLVHLVRNALDHGIETADVRRAAGKPDTGVLELEAYHKGGNIVIEIRDDGAGLDRERILAKARERGIVAPTQSLSESDINELIFHPGFSTAETVSDVSGRGVGMDVVLRNIKGLGGSVEICSEKGRGTTFSVRLPLTLSILDGQLVRVGNQTYVVPLISIVESLQIRSGQVNSLAGRTELYKLRDDYIPMVRLYDVFEATPDSTTVDGGLMVVVEGDGRRAGLLVDDLLAQQQVVIKSLETNFRRVEGVSGATILGDGTVALILDVAGLISRCRTRVEGAPQTAHGAQGNDTAAA